MRGHCGPKLTNPIDKLLCWYVLYIFPLPTRRPASTYHITGVSNFCILAPKVDKYNIYSIESWYHSDQITI